MDSTSISQLKNLLSQLEPGYLPEPIFLEFTRLSVTPICELVPLRKTSAGEIEVLLCRRPSSDQHLPDMLHTPGTVLRSTDDDDLEQPLSRAFEEIHRDYKKYEVKKSGVIFHAVKRGKELAIIFSTIIQVVQEQDIWMPLSQIEKQVVDTQVNFITEAAKVAFR